MAKMKAKPKADGRPTTRKPARVAAGGRARAPRPETPAPSSPTPAREPRPPVRREAAQPAAPDRMVVDIAPPQTQDLPILQKQAASLQIVSVVARGQAYDFLRKTLRPRIAGIRDVFAGIKRSIMASHKHVLDLERETLAPYVALDDQTEKAILAFDDEQARLRREAEERERKQREALAARASSVSAEAQELIDAAAEMEQSARELTGEDRREALEAAKELRQQAAVMSQGATKAMQVLAPPKPSAAAVRAETKGRSRSYHAEIRNMGLLVAAVAQGKVALAALEPERFALRENHPHLNRLARDYGEALSIPGVVAVPDDSIR